MNRWWILSETNLKETMTSLLPVELRFKTNKKRLILLFLTVRSSQLLMWLIFRNKASPSESGIIWQKWTSRLTDRTNRCSSWEIPSLSHLRKGQKYFTRAKKQRLKEIPSGLANLLGSGGKQWSHRVTFLLNSKTVLSPRETDCNIHLWSKTL